ncbi:hypothetical protein RMATCC62417_16519 [Rhizopus microsporus]|nr:hypothetical protein RMATCC62417_16519 [Rhizopus microsporus]
MMAEFEQYQAHLHHEKPGDTFMKAVDAEHQKRANKKAPYTASFYQQVKALTVRQFYLNLTDIGALISRYGTILIQSLITASCFFKMAEDGAGAFSRGGALFFALLFNAFISQSELVAFLMGRPILEKHKQYALYRPSAFYIAQVVMDVPYAVVQVLLFEICAYFMMGLKLTAGAFFSFFIILFFINMCMNGFFRFFGASTSSFFLATQLSGTVLIAVTSYTGYTIPYNKMHPWLSWIYWINPLTYGYKALLINELKGQHYSCDGLGNSIPSGPGYDDWNYKTCVMAGGKPGASFVLGDDYLNEYLSYNPEQMWAPDFVVLVAFFLFFTVVTAATMELGGLSKAGTLTKLYLPGKAPKPRTPEEEEARRKRQANINSEMENVSTGTTFSWQDVNYTVPIKGGQLQLLNNVSGIVKPGHLTALMGSSGADTFAKRYRGQVCYNEEEDQHYPTLTAKQTLQFALRLKTPGNRLPNETKKEFVNKILYMLGNMLGLTKQMNTMVGNAYVRGLSGGERKRMSIAEQMTTSSSINCWDCSTRGLDAASALDYTRALRIMTDVLKKTTIATLYQASNNIFTLFDKVMVLDEGRCIYFGPTDLAQPYFEALGFHCPKPYYGEIGRDSQTMISYFERNGGPQCAPDANPAEYILECVGAGTAGKAKADWAAIWEKSAEAKRLQEELEQIHNVADKNPTRTARTYATNTWTQFKLVHKRMALAYWRSPDYNIGRFLNVMFTSLITGFTFWKLGNSSSDLLNKLFALFSTFIMAMTLIILAQPKFITERQYFRREYASRYYSWFPWGISALLVEMPYIFIFAACFMFGFYWTAGMNASSEASEFYYSRFGWDEAHKWRNFGILIAYFAFNCIVFLMFVYLRRKPRR